MRKSRLSVGLTSHRHTSQISAEPGPDLRKEGGGPTKPFIFYFSLMIDAYTRLRLSCRALLITVLVRPNFYSALHLAIVQFSSPFVP